jgi:hypothetical protein
MEKVFSNKNDGKNHEDWKEHQILNYKTSLTATTIAP